MECSYSLHRIFVEFQGCQTALDGQGSGEKGCYTTASHMLSEREMHPPEQKPDHELTSAYPCKAVENNRNSPHKKYKAALVAFFVGSSTFLLGVMVTVISDYFFKGTYFSAFFDDFVIALCTALVVFVYERRRNRYLIERLRIIEEMNHHVRNALQAVSFSMYSSTDSKLRELLRKSSDRIEWALYEILPGKTKP